MRVYFLSHQLYLSWYGPMCLMQINGWMDGWMDNVTPVMLLDLTW